MVFMLEKKYANVDLEIELTSYIDSKQNVWFRGKDVAKILGYSNTYNALERHVSYNHKQFICCSPEKNIVHSLMRLVFMNLYLVPNYQVLKGSVIGYSLHVLPSIRKYGQYKLFDSPWNKMIMILNETDLHYKVVDLIRKYYPDSILVAGLGENQDTDNKRLDSCKKGYIRGQPDLMILDYHKDYKGLCIEFKLPSNNYHVSEAQKEMKKKYVNNGYAFVLSNYYDRICMNIHDYMKGIRLPCKYCIKHFLNNDTLTTHYRVIHRII